MFRGNIVMKGYLKNRKATDEAFAGGWFHSGDLGVMHPDGYIQLKDRSKDIIISGGENISSIEVEDALYKHPGRGLLRRGRAARREMGRDAGRLCRAEARHDGDARRRSSSIAARCSPASNARRRWSSPRSRRPRRARSRNSGCANWRSQLQADLRRLDDETVGGRRSVSARGRRRHIRKQIAIHNEPSTIQASRAAATGSLRSQYKRGQKNARRCTEFLHACDHLCAVRHGARDPHGDHRRIMRRCRSTPTRWWRAG